MGGRGSVSFRECVILEAFNPMVPDPHSMLQSGLRGLFKEDKANGSSRLHFWRFPHVITC